MTVELIMSNVQVPTNDHSFERKLFLRLQNILPKRRIILLHPVIQSLLIPPGRRHININQHKLIELQRYHSPLFRVFCQVNVLEHLDRWVFGKHGDSRIAQRVFGKVPVRVVAPELVGVFEVGLLVEFGFVDTQNVRVVKLQVGKELVLFHSCSNAIDVPRMNQQFFRRLSRSINPSMNAGLYLFVLDLKVFRVEYFKVSCL
jgi:hypothetical protein